eukprot:12400182-Karenia_brevis.AAC.1
MVMVMVMMVMINDGDDGDADDDDGHGDDTDIHRRHCIPLQEMPPLQELALAVQDLSCHKSCP